MATTQEVKVPRVEITEAVQKLREGLLERLVAQAAQGHAPWQQKLDPVKGERLPYDPFSKTGQALQGVNGLVLTSMAQEKGFTDPRWVTKYEMEQRGWGPIKGQSPASIEQYSDRHQVQKRDWHGNPIFDAKGNAVKEEVMHEVPRVYAVNMYNLSQIRELQYAREPIPQLEIVQRSPDAKSLDALVRASGAEVRVDGGNNFQKTQDGRGVIHVPATQGIAQQQALLRGVVEKAVLIDGPAGARRDDNDQTRFVKQQLRVDLAARVMSEKLGIPTDPGKMAAFKGKYAEILKNNPDEIRYAARDAYRAVERLAKGNFEPAKDRQWSKQQDHGAERKEPEAQREQKAPRGKAKGQEPGR